MARLLTRASSSMRSLSRPPHASWVPPHLLSRASSSRFLCAPALAAAEPEPLNKVLNLLAQKDDDLREKDKLLLHYMVKREDDLRQRDDDLRKKDDDLRKKEKQLHHMELALQEARYESKGLRMEMLRVVYQMKVRGIMEMFVSVAKGKLTQEGISFSGKYPFQEILQYKGFSKLKACLQARTGKQEDYLLVQDLRSLLTYLNGLHHPVVEEGERIFILKQEFNVDVYGRMMLCIGDALNIKILFVDEQVPHGSS